MGIFSWQSLGEEGGISATLACRHHSNTAETSAITNQERYSAWGRSVVDIERRMSGGPLYALIGGSATVSILSFWEGMLFIKANTAITWQESTRFVFRYSISQLIPSVVWHSQPPQTIARLMGISSEYFYTSPLDAPPKRTLTLNKLRALRGAIAGSVVLSQVFALMDVISQSHNAYAERIQQGREPPLEDSSRKGVVIWLAGETSLMTNLTMAREGRRHLFPIYEDPEHPDVQTMINKHASGCQDVDTSETSSTPWLSSLLYCMQQDSQDQGPSIPRVPIYWKVQDGRYSHASSWQGMKIPENWLFDLPNTNEKLLMLEADATSGTNTSMSLKRGMLKDFDLDLYEVAQGFTQLVSLVEHRHLKNHNHTKYKAMRVLLVDPEAIFQSGGGRQTTAREHTVELGLADVIVDARTPLLYSMTKWLEAFHQYVDKKGKNTTSKNTRWNKRKSKAVILETPEEDWFLSIRDELDRFGYTVMDRADALKEFGSLEGIPVFIYEKTTSETFHTVRQFVQLGMLHPKQVCAMCPRPWSLEALMGSRVPGVTYICSADLYDRLLRWVRDHALHGRTAEEIQKPLDETLPEIMNDVMNQNVEALQAFQTIENQQIER
jgi:hypothetical protein